MGTVNEDLLPLLQADEGAGSPAAAEDEPVCGHRQPPAGAGAAGRRRQDAEVRAAGKPEHNWQTVISCLRGSEGRLNWL